MSMAARSHSQQATQQQPQSQVLRTSEQIQSDLLYLKDHKVCERLEHIVKSLLHEQPADPVLFICRMLRESSKASSVIRASANAGLGASSPSGVGKLADRFGQPEPLLPPLVAGGGSGELPEVAVETDSPKSDAAAGSATGSPAPLFASSGAGPSFPSGLPPLTTPTASTNQAGQSAQQLPMGVKPGSVQSSRVGTPAAVQVRKGGFDIQLGAGGGAAGTSAAAQLRTALEREESCKSETSCFSISSVDMSEFLAEFRVAHYALFGEHHQRISKMELADVVDRVNIPLPDVRMLVDLFDELDDGTSLVRFDAFLSRMNFRIQGRYPLELIKAVYFSILPGMVNGGVTPLARYYMEGAVGSGRTTPNNTASLSSSGGAGGHQLQRSSSASSKTSANVFGYQHAQQQPSASTAVAGVQSRPVSSSAAVAAAGSTTNNTGGSVSRRVCREDGMWEGLGIRVSLADFNRATQQLGIPSDDDAPCQVTDFVRLVNFITGQTKEEDMS